MFWRLKTRSSAGKLVVLPVGRLEAIKVLIAEVLELEPVPRRRFFLGIGGTRVRVYGTPKIKPFSFR
jgi:hypothetical protein